MSKKKLSHKQKWFKEIVLTKDDHVYVGLDVHKKSIHVAERMVEEGVSEAIGN